MRLIHDCVGIYYENNLIFYPKPYNKTIKLCI